MRSIDSGLEIVERSPDRGFVQATAGASTLAGPFAQLEGGMRLAPRLAAFAFGRWEPVASSAGAGLRFTF